MTGMQPVAIWVRPGVFFTVDWDKPNPAEAALIRNVHGDDITVFVGDSHALWSFAPKPVVEALFAPCFAHRDSYTFFTFAGFSGERGENTYRCSTEAVGYTENGDDRDAIRYLRENAVAFCRPVVLKAGETLEVDNWREFIGFIDRVSVQITPIHNEHV